MKIFCTLPKKNRAGSGMLAMALILCFITSITALTSARLTNSMFSTVTINKIKVEADQYAQNKAALLRTTPYDKLSSEAKSAIATSGYFQAVTVGEEITPVLSTMKQKEITIKIFYGNETTPLSTLQLTRSAWKSSGCPIGSIIAWPVGSLPLDGGTWLLCTGETIPGKYASLRSLVGSTTPDLRGKFLRGYGAYDDNHKSGPLLAVQSDAVQRLQGSFYTYVPQYIGNNPYTSNSWKTSYQNFTTAMFPALGVFAGGNSAAWEDTAFDRQDGNGRDNYTYVFQINFSNYILDKQLGTEVVPINTAVNFLIKAE